MRRALAVLVWGAGGHGRVVADAVRAAGHRLVGYVDADPALLGAVAEPGGGRVIALEDELRAVLRDGAALPGGGAAVVPALGDNVLRLACVDALGERAAPGLAHPAATVSRSAEMGAGTVVFPAAVVNAGAVLGRAVIANTGSIVEHDCVLGDGVHLSPGAVLGGGVHVGRGSWIGAGATVIHGVRVGRGSIVGAGAVIIRDVPEGVTVVGNPGRIITGRHHRTA